MLCPGAITQGQFVSGALELAQEPAKSCHQVGQAKGGFDLSVPSTSKVPHASTHHLGLSVTPLTVTKVRVTPVGSGNDRVADSWRVDRVDLNSEVKGVLGEEGRKGR